MEPITQNLELPRDDLHMELESMITDWDKFDYNKRVLYYKLYFIHKFNMCNFGKCSLSDIFKPENLN